MKLYFKNQLNDGHIIEFCCGEQEFRLEPDEEVTVEIQDEDSVYFDVVS